MTEIESMEQPDSMLNKLNWNSPILYIDLDNFLAQMSLKASKLDGYLQGRVVSDSCSNITCLLKLKLPFLGRVGKAGI